MTDTTPQLTDTTPKLIITEYTRSVLLVMLDKPRSWHSAPDVADACGLTAQSVRGVLQRLESAGWLGSQWEEPGIRPTPPRRLYAFAAGGKAAAKRAI